MEYKFKDERIQFCLEAYESSVIGKNFLNKVFDGLPKEVYNAIDNYSNTTIKNGKNKINLTFNKSGLFDAYDAFRLTVQKGENIYSINVCYSYFSSDLVSGEDTNKTILYADHKIQKGLFSSPKREFGQHAFLHKEFSKFTISIIDSIKSTHNNYLSISYDAVNKLNKLKTKESYMILDKKTYEKANGKCR